MADPDDRAYPTKDQVTAAEQRAEAKARDVGAIKASLMMANQQVEQAEIAEAQAWESYNGAMWELDEAKKQVRAARAEAKKARATVAEQGEAIGRLIATSYQQGSQLTALGAMMGAEGPEGVLDQYVAFQGASTSMEADYDRFAASDSLAKVFEKKAKQAREEQTVLAEKARVAKEAAESAAASAQATASQIAAEKDSLIRELAAAQNISFDLAQQRQTALEEIARQRAAAQAQAEAEAAAKAQAARDRAAAVDAREDAQARTEAQDAQARDARALADRRQKRRDQRLQSQDAQVRAEAREAQARADAREDARDARALADRRQQRRDQRQDRREQRQDRREQRQERRQDRQESQDSYDPPPAPAPRGSGGAVESAISFTKAQLGEQYVWGGTGPSTWDCSGLMLRAFESAGIYLPRVSRDQYSATTPISLGELRRGDLLFWGSSPGSIYHVAMYLGGGQMIHAPNSRSVVRIESMYNWMPNMYGRV